MTFNRFRSTLASLMRHLRKALGLLRPDDAERAHRSYPRKPCVNGCGKVLAHTHDGTRPWHKHKCQPSLPIERDPLVVAPADYFDILKHPTRLTPDLDDIAHNPDPRD